jgi:hypothetical protein
MVAILALYHRTAISRTALFWTAFVLTRPLGATAGDLLWKPHSSGGLGLGSANVSYGLLRIDGAGLTVSGRPTVPWSEVRKAEEARGAVVFFSWGAEERLPLLPYDILAFTGERRRRKQLTGRFGSPMVLPTRLYGVRPAEVMSAVRTYDGRAALFR